MQGSTVLPKKASAFVIVRRPDGAILCTVENDGRVGVPGGKWAPELDGSSWMSVTAREFAEEVGAPIPPALRSGYLEWGHADYQTRFLVLAVSQEAADSLPVGHVDDPDHGVVETFWSKPNAMKDRGRVRPHIADVIGVLVHGSAVPFDIFFASRK